MWLEKPRVPRYTSGHTLRRSPKDTHRASWEQGFLPRLYILNEVLLCGGVAASAL
jgi:hypothetical protein